MNTVSNLESLFKCQATLAKAMTMLSKVLFGYVKDVGPDYTRSPIYDIAHSLQVDIVMGNEASVTTEELVDIFRGETSRLDAAGVPLEAKRYELFRKFDYCLCKV
jgi:2-phosphoglycerate kinase